ncbi:hypothetical protein CDAR_105191 [Caerostris darwini]|uniref:Uncharacterized protein n=1 Tax=Caerostris darwini TaxID=1538125 RepID=A0AAV4V5E8_9ARAC|nr:hypothetical protein CDAR_105191 [Caerostris darwini]
MFWSLLLSSRHRGVFLLNRSSKCPSYSEWHPLLEHRGRVRMRQMTPPDINNFEVDHDCQLSSYQTVTTTKRRGLNLPEWMMPDGNGLRGRLEVLPLASRKNAAAKITFAALLKSVTEVSTPVCAGFGQGCFGPTERGKSRWDSIAKHLAKGTAPTFGETAS